MHDEREIIEGRIRREISERIRPAIFSHQLALAVAAHEVDGEPVEAKAVVDALFTSIESGAAWGRPWGTTWFRFSGRVPSDWPMGAIEAVIDLGFAGGGPGFQAEGLVYEGLQPRKGIHPLNRSVPLPNTRSGEEVEVLVEAASNPDFSVGFRANQLGSLESMAYPPLYSLGSSFLAVRDPEVDGLLFDLSVLTGVMRTCALDDPRRVRLLRTVERALDELNLHEVAATASAARAILAPALKVPARASSHRVLAIGHAHIDTAWLWPLRETVRKCTRTFSSAVELMDGYPEYRFACSQAAQYAWIEERHPDLFDRIKAKVAAGQWVPVGGMWVEADMNLPSGESIVRQLVHGQRYFESRFGARCKEVWIPDVFGYPGSLPQIFAGAGCERFITQKLSWNKQNRMPHHTFRWEGIDGSRVLTHFPPVDTYNADIVPSELAHASTNFADKAWSDWSLMPFGYGDGGGGPTRDMLERARRLGDLDGSPRVTLGTPDDFFEQVEAEAEAGDIAVWRGELYFEMHRGTLTSQINTKLGNRRAERLLREAELWHATLGTPGTPERLDQLWKDVLILQFHDILPGSSINRVHMEAEAEYERVAADLEAIVAEALDQLAADGPALANAATHGRSEIAVLPVAPPGAGPTQTMAEGGVAFRTLVPGLSVVPAEALEVDDEVVVDGRSMSNGELEVSWDESGVITSIVALDSGRELLRPGRRGAVVTLAPDHPVEFDAWDLERWASRRAEPIDTADEVVMENVGPLVATLRVTRSFGRSRLVERYRLDAGTSMLEVSFEIDWQEDEKVLCFDLPLDVRSDTAACGIQFGHVNRPVHTNTSWDSAKFEVCAHRWVDLAEPGFGVAVLDDGRYGHALQDGGIRVTLLRAANYPDPTADRGMHRCRLGILAHSGDRARVVREAEAFEWPLRPVLGGNGAAPSPIVSVDHSGVLVSAVKQADDGSGDLVVRMHEAQGGRATAMLTVPTATISAELTDLLEDPLGRSLAVTDGKVAVELRPFQLVTLRLH